MHSKLSPLCFLLLRWSLKRGSDGIFAVDLDNPSPYHINLLGVKLVDAQGKSLYESDAGAMAEPGKSVQLPIKTMTQSPAGKFKVRYTYLNDFGGAVDRDVDLTESFR